MSVSERPLTGVGVLVTRPAGQAAALARRIEEVGGRAIVFPTIEILDVEDPCPLQAQLDRLADFDLAVFISPNAVEKAFARLRQPVPDRLRLAAVGKGSARELARRVDRPVLAPADGADSEALLRLPELQDVAGKRIIVFRGVGGRELLARTLEARGAEVRYAECYRRAKPEADVAPLLADWRSGAIQAVSITSSESLRNLGELLGEAGLALLRSTPVFTLHERIAAAARALGVADVTVTEAGDDALLAALTQRFAT